MTSFKPIAAMLLALACWSCNAMHATAAERSPNADRAKVCLQAWKAVFGSGTLTDVAIDSVTATNGPFEKVEFSGFWSWDLDTKSRGWYRYAVEIKRDGSGEWRNCHLLGKIKNR